MMARLPLHHCLAWMLLAAASAAVAFAQQPAPPLRDPAVPSSAELPTERTPQLQPGEFGFVVLTDGRVFSGKLRDTGGGYRLEAAGNVMVVPYDDVQVTAVSLVEAYRKLHAAMKAPRAVDHVKLAEWCCRHDLWTEAKQQAILALQLDPLRQDARKLLLQIQQKIDPALEGAISGNGLNPASPANELTEQGVSRETLQAFVRQVQPLLQNKCGNANCHGRAASNGFRLTGSRSAERNHRLSNEQNLETVLGLISTDAPLSSPLLTKLADGSREHKSLFRGPLGTSQHQILVDWVERVAAEKREASPHAPASTTSGPQIIRTASLGPGPSGDSEAPSADLPLIEPDQLAGPIPQTLGGAEPTPKLPGEVLREVLHQQPPDAFDPEEFNRLVHGTTPNR